MKLLEWLDVRPTGSLAAAAQPLDLAVTEIEVPLLRPRRCWSDRARVDAVMDIDN